MIVSNIFFMILLVVQAIAIIILFNKVKALAPKWMMLIGTILNFFMLLVWSVLSHVMLNDGGYEQIELYSKFSMIYTISSFVAHSLFVIGLLLYTISIQPELEEKKNDLYL